MPAPAHTIAWLRSIWVRSRLMTCCLVYCTRDLPRISSTSNVTVTAIRVNSQSGVLAPTYS